jgi:hypothetical protein
MASCNANYYDLNKQSSDGCEYYCVKTNGGIEICDYADNDCDGAIDEGFNTSTDKNNCGGCGNVCTFSNAASSCVAGKCEMGTCQTGFKNLDGQEMTGCEYKCPVWPALTSDECDGLDNDCDGQIDENFKATSCGISTGECIAGTYECVGGTKVCKGGTGPAAEVCDNKDNDCDGNSDEDFDKSNDPRYCGTACTKCSIPHAIAKCTSGQCAIAVCLNGWVDLDKQLSNGCEYQCTITGAEICDGVDNDCNGKTDTSDPGMIALGSNPCFIVGACAGSSASCKGAAGWVCSYPNNPELKPCLSPSECLSNTCTGGTCPGEIAAEETKCDSKDNDCDGLTDETFTTKGEACIEKGKLGICQGSGTWICNSAGTSVTCNISSPGGTPSDELCNGKDDDCDGKIDEEADDTYNGIAYKGVKDAMVYINKAYKGKTYSYYIYTYEASRPDADGKSAGSLASRACSKTNVLPWSDITYTEASAACAAAGKRLCTGIEWFLACSGAPSDPSGCTTTPGDGCYFPYGDTFSANTCNGKDADLTKDALRVTGGASNTCATIDADSDALDERIYDMSGNLKEWTNDPQSDGVPPDPDGYTVRGGAYDSTYFGMRCDFSFTVLPPSFYYPNLGFRCCSNAAP